MAKPPERNDGRDCKKPEMGSSLHSLFFFLPFAEQNGITTHAVGTPSAAMQRHVISLVGANTQRAAGILFFFKKGHN